MKKYKFILIFVVFLILTTIILTATNYNKSRGKKLYIEHCSKCHRTTGKGIKRVYPPVKNSDYIQKASSEEIIRGMLFGRSGEIIVNGKKYNGVMTTEIDETVSDDDIALITMYIYREFNGINKAVTAQDVKKAREKGKLPPH